MIGFEVDDRAVLRSMDAIENMPDRDMMEIVADAVMDLNMRRYQRKVGPDGNAWEPWSVNTKKKHGGHGLMVDSGDLRASFEVVNLGSASADVGTAIPYAAYHQDGAGRLPVREVLGVAPGDLPILGDLLFKYLEDQVG